MDTLDLYYSTEKLSTWNKYIAVPVNEIEIDFYTDKKKLNIFQEIALELFKCGHGDIKSIEEVLKINIFDKDEENNDVEGLSHYIVKELNQLEYISGKEITQKGIDILEENIDDEKMLGSLFYNTISREYINFLKDNYLYESNNEDVTLKKHSLSKDEQRNGRAKLGSVGKVQEIKFIFLDKNIEQPKITIDDFMRVIDGEIKKINQQIEIYDLGEKNFGVTEKIGFLKEKRKLLFEVRKFKVKDSIKSYVLVPLIDGEIRNPFYPHLLDRSLGEDLKKIEKVKSYFKDFIKEIYGTSKGDNIQIRKNFNEKESEIVNDSQGKLGLLPDLVTKLANISNENSDNLEKEDKYEKNIQLIYECFGEVLLYLFKKYSQNCKLSKKANNKLKLETVLKNDYRLSKELISDYTYGLDNNSIPYIKNNKKLKDLLSYVLILESDIEENKLQNYIKKDTVFFTFIKNLIKERNKFSHAGEDNRYIDEDIEFDFELEAENKLIDFIENIFEFKFENALNLEIIDKESIKNLKAEASENIGLEFAGRELSELKVELVDVELDFIYYKNFKNTVSKALFMKKVGILLEKNLKILRKKLNKKITLDNSLDIVNKIYLEDIEERFFKKISPTDSWIDQEFEKIKKEVYISTEKIKKTEKTFQKGTLNTCASVLLYSEENENIKDTIKICPEFFKLVFIVSALRKHNGYFNINSNENDKDEVEAVREFLERVYNIQKKLLIIRGE